MDRIFNPIYLFMIKLKHALGIVNTFFIYQLRRESLLINLFEMIQILLKNIKVFTCESRRAQENISVQNDLFPPYTLFLR